MGGSWNIFQSGITDEPRIRKKSRKFEEGTEEEDAEISKKSQKLGVEVKEMSQKNDIEEKENTKTSQTNDIQEKENTTKKSQKILLK